MKEKRSVIYIKPRKILLLYVSFLIFRFVKYIGKNGTPTKRKKINIITHNGSSENGSSTIRINPRDQKVAQKIQKIAYNYNQIFSFHPILFILFP